MHDCCDHSRSPMYPGTVRRSPMATGGTADSVRLCSRGGRPVCDSDREEYVVCCSHIGSPLSDQIWRIMKYKSDTIENEKLFETNDYIFFVLLTALNCSAILYFVIYWFSPEYWQHNPILFSLMTLILSIIMANSQVRWFILLYMKRPKPVVARAGWKIAVVTTFVPGAEPLEMLEETVLGLVNLDYPHDTWVLDEGDEDHVKALCYALGAQHFSRKNLPRYHTAHGSFQSHSKHGNYNAWLTEIGFEHYDIITAFDPDHVPQPSFLSHVLGYFEDPQVGYVQMAAGYYNRKASFIARGAAEETYSFYSTIQMASYGMGCSVPTRL